MVAACNEIYVFCTCCLKLETDFYKLSLINNAAKSVLADLIVLAKSAAQSTACKKDCAAATKNCYKRFFSKVKAGKGNAEVCGFTAKADGGAAINSALSRALVALFVELSKISH